MVVPAPSSDSISALPPACAAKPWICESPRPVPLPTSLVVKKGSNARSDHPLGHAEPVIA